MPKSNQTMQDILKAGNMESYQEYYEQMEYYGAQELSQPLQELAKLTNQLSRKGRDGLPMRMNQSIVHTLQKYYSDIMDICDRLLQGAGTESKEKTEYLRSLSSRVQNEMGALENIRANETIYKEKAPFPSYPELMRRNNRRVLRVLEEVKTVGGAMSSRIPLRILNQDNVLEQGFFTIDKRVEYRQMYLDALKAAVKKFPQIQSLADELAQKDETAVIEAFSTIGQTSGKSFLYPLAFDEKYLQKTDDNGVPISEEQLQQQKRILKQKILENWKNGLKKLGIEQEKYASVLKDEKGIEELYGLGKEIESFDNAKSVYKMATVDENTVIGSRNVAMSAVATRLGKPELLAKAVHASVVIDGTVKNGIFMNYADGKLVDEILPDNPEIGGAEVDFETPELMESMADLQVLDYICGNIDRHSGNLAFLVEKNENGIPQIKGVQGIDNDLSFGARNQEMDLKNMSSPDELGAVSEQMAKKILDLSQERLISLLAEHGMKTEEIEAAWERVETLQTKIREGQAYYEKNLPTKENPLTKNYLRVMKKEEWKEIQIKDMVSIAPPNRKYQTGFQILQKLQGIVHRQAEVMQKCDEQTKEIVYDDWKKDHSKVKLNSAFEVKTEADALAAQKEKIKELYDQFRKTDGTFHRNTREYKGMFNALQQMYEHIDYMEKKLSETGAVSDNDYNYLSQIQHKVRFGVENYLSKKPLDPKSPLGKQRRSLALNLKAIMGESIKELKEDELRAEAEKQKQLLNRIQNHQSKLDDFSSIWKSYSEDSMMYRLGESAQKHLERVVGKVAKEELSIADKRELVQSMAVLTCFKKLDISEKMNEVPGKQGKENRMHRKIEERPEFVSTMMKYLAKDQKFQERILDITRLGVNDMLGGHNMDQYLKKLSEYCDEQKIWERCRQSRERDMQGESLKQEVLPENIPQKESLERELTL